MPEPDDWEAALRQELRSLPCPPVSADFDVRVLTALSAPPPWWQSLWQQARPLLTGAACSLVVTLTLVSWSLRAPTAPPPAATPPVAARPLDMTALERLLDRPRLSAASLAGWDVPPPSPADRPRTPPRPSEHAAGPERRSSLTA